MLPRRSAVVRRNPLRYGEEPLKLDGFDTGLLLKSEELTLPSPVSLKVRRSSLFDFVKRSLNCSFGDRISSGLAMNLVLVVVVVGVVVSDGDDDDSSIPLTL